MMKPHQIGLLAELSINKKVHATLLLVGIVVFTSISHLSLVIVKNITKGWQILWKTQLFSTEDHSFNLFPFVFIKKTKVLYIGVLVSVHSCWTLLKCLCFSISLLWDIIGEEKALKFTFQIGTFQFLYSFWH